MENEENKELERIRRAKLQEMMKKSKTCEKEEKVATPIPSKRKRQSVSSKIDSLWFFLIGALTALGVLVLQGALGFWNDSDLIYGVALPIFYSIVAGSIVGIVAYLIIPHIN